MLKEISPEFNQYTKHFHFNFFGEGSAQNMSKYDFKGAKLENKDGTLAIGEHQSINNVVNTGLNEASNSFKEELQKLDISKEQREEIEGAVSAVEKEVETAKPNKIVLSSLLETIKNTITVASASPSLINAYDKWKAFFEPFVN